MKYRKRTEPIKLLNGAIGVYKIQNCFWEHECCIGSYNTLTEL